MNVAIKTDGIMETRYRIGMWVFLASIAMLFTSLSSAYIVRSGMTYDWLPLAVPRAMFGSTALILLGSVSIEMARRKLSSRYLLLTLILGIGFISSQLIAWRELARQGMYLSTHPHSSFFYLLTGAHAVHVGGGLLALGLLWFRSRQRLQQPHVTALSIYWHFMGALWIYLFLLLFLWR